MPTFGSSIKRAYCRQRHVKVMAGLNNFLGRLSVRLARHQSLDKALDVSPSPAHHATVLTQTLENKLQITQNKTERFILDMNADHNG